MSYIALATTTLGSAASSVTFSSIPATYKDLIVVADILTADNDRDLYLRANSDSGNSYPYVLIQGQSSGAQSGAATRTGLLVGYKNTGNSKANFVATVMDYSATDKHKTSLSRYNEGGFYVFAAASRWPSNSALTSLTVLASLGNIASGTTLSLYGVA